MGFTVPRGSVHEDLGRIVTTHVFAGLVFTNDDAVIAENFYIMERGPEPRRRALACPGVADKQVAGALGPNDADAVELDRALLREAVHDQELVERVLQGVWGDGDVGKKLLAHL